MNPIDVITRIGKLMLHIGVLVVAIEIVGPLFGLLGFSVALVLGKYALNVKKINEHAKTIAQVLSSHNKLRNHAADNSDQRNDDDCLSGKSGCEKESRD